MALKQDPIVKIVEVFKGLSPEQQQTALAFMRQETRQTTVRKLREKPKSAAKPLVTTPTHVG